MNTPAYPIVENVALVDPTAVQTYIDMIFGYVEWGDRVISMRGIGEKGTPQEGVFREPVWIHPAWQPPGNAAAKHAVRWSQHHVACFIVPAVVDAAAVEKHEAKEEHIREMTTVLVDLDSGDTDAKLRWLETHIGPATMVVYSGGTTDSGQPKLHIYWALTELSEEVRRIGDLRRALAEKIGDDRSFQRITQIIRVPGSVHAKHGAARTVSIARYHKGRDYDLDDLAEKITEMPTMPGVTAPQAQPTLTLPTGMMDFSGAQPPRMPVSQVMTTDVREGGGEEHNRWSSFNQVVGHYLHMARLGNVSLEEAAGYAHGWMIAHMQPPWPDARFRTEFQALVNLDVKNHGPLQPAPGWGALPAAEALETTYNRETGELIRPMTQAIQPIATTEDLLSWAVHRRSNAAPQKRRILVDGLIMVGKRHLLVAEGGAGKTFVCMDLALKLAAYDPNQPPLKWMGQQILPDADDGTVILLTAEDDRDELDLRWAAIDPGKHLRARAGDRLIALPLDNLGGAFPLVATQRGGAVAPSEPWIKLYTSIRGLAERGRKISAVIIDTLNSTLHGEENSAVVIGEYIRAVAPICGELGAAFVVTHHIRKEGKDPIRTVDDMKQAIRGSSALPNAMRMVIGIWHASDWKRRMKGMGLHPRRGSLYRMAVTKANMSEALSEVKTLLRAPSGLLEDVTQQDALRDGPGGEHAAWLVLAVKEAAMARSPFTKTGSNGLFARKHHLPPMLQALRDYELRILAETLLETGKLVAGRLANQRGGHPGHLDVPGGPVARGQGYNDAGAWTPNWDVWEFDDGLNMVVRFS